MVKLPNISTPTHSSNSSINSPTSSDQSSPTSTLPLPPSPEFTIMPSLLLPLHHYPPLHFHQHLQQIVYSPFYPSPYFYYSTPPETPGFYYPPPVEENPTPEFFIYPQTTPRGKVSAARGPRSAFKSSNPRPINVSPARNNVNVIKVWKPKVTNESDQNPNKSSTISGGIPADLANCTTIMLKNIPNAVSRKNLIEMLDRHCRRQNGKGNNNNPSQYDFLYLPFDFRHGQNLGYAFINFTTVEGASNLYTCWKNKGWYESPKIRTITPAKLQGLSQCKRHFQTSVFVCNTEEFLPIEFSPPRNGFNGDICLVKTVGKWIFNDCLSKGSTDQGLVAKTINPPGVEWIDKTVQPPRLSCATVK